jgi:hypothetical protein
MGKQNGQLVRGKPGATTSLRHDPMSDTSENEFGASDFGTNEHLSDVNDQASRHEMLVNREALAAVRRKAQIKRLPADPGFCDECGEVTQSEVHLFCSMECSRKDELRTKQKSRSF